jgi:hypothetical protein
MANGYTVRELHEEILKDVRIGASLHHTVLPGLRRLDVGIDVVEWLETLLQFHSRQHRSMDRLSRIKVFRASIDRLKDRVAQDSELEIPGFVNKWDTGLAGSWISEMINALCTLPSTRSVDLRICWQRGRSVSPLPHNDEGLYMRDLEAAEENMQEEFMAWIRAKIPEKSITDHVE